MNDLVEFIEDLTLKVVNRDKLFKWLYENKTSPNSLWFKLSTASKLVRQDYLEQFNEGDGIYEY